MKLAFVFLLISLPVLATTHRSPRSADKQVDGSRSDVELTRRIRERLVQDDSLSIYAENITILTLGSNVTLKGEVNSRTEGEKIATIVRSLAGPKKVDNQLIYRR